MPDSCRWRSEEIPDSGAPMPWQETDVTRERVKFVLEWERRWDEGEGRMNFAELCREFGISRQQGYLWRDEEKRRRGRRNHNRGRRPRNRRRARQPPCAHATDASMPQAACRAAPPE
jgi:hypothetical protein